MIEYIMWFLLSSVMLVSGGYLTYWLIIEMPVLRRIKQESLYKQWKDR